LKNELIQVSNLQLKKSAFNTITSNFIRVKFEQENDRRSRNRFNSWNRCCRDYLNTFDCCYHFMRSVNISNRFFIETTCLLFLIELNIFLLKR